MFPIKLDKPEQLNLTLRFQMIFFNFKIRNHENNIFIAFYTFIFW